MGVQAVNAQTPASGTALQLNYGAPTTDRWNFSAVEPLAPKVAKLKPGPVWATGAMAQRSGTPSLFPKFGPAI